MLTSMLGPWNQLPWNIMAHNCFLNNWTHNTSRYFDSSIRRTNQTCNLMVLLKVCMLDYEDVCMLRTDGSSPVPMDTTSAQPQQADLLRCREKGKQHSECLLNLKDWPWLTGGEVSTVFALIEIHEILKKVLSECKTALDRQEGRKRNGTHNVWLDGLIQEDDGIHKCINTEIQFSVQIDFFVRGLFSRRIRHHKKRL